MAMFHTKVWIERAQPPEHKRAEFRATPEPETLTAKVLAEFQPDEAERIVTVWREILGIKLDRDPVHQHLEGLRK